MRINSLIITVVALSSLNGCFTAKNVEEVPTHSSSIHTCEQNPQRQLKMSAELKLIEQEDQADRSVSFDKIDWSKVTPRDLERRKKVAAIFAEGCFKTAADYGYAAMVFQHGTSADHYYQTFLWASTAAKLGDTSKKSLAAAGIDRYLVKIGQKQLFGTQFSKDKHNKFCLQPVEKTFPDARRVEFLGNDLKSNIEVAMRFIAPDQKAHETIKCDIVLKDTPKGSVEGFW